MTADGGGGGGRGSGFLGNGSGGRGGGRVWEEMSLGSALWVLGAGVCVRIFSMFSHWGWREG